MDKKPDLLDAFIYGPNADEIKVEWFDIKNKEEIPNLPWAQVYAVGDLDGKTPVIFYDHAKDNLPGGHVESGESIEQTLLREIQEELNCEVIEWWPIGYQILTNTSDRSAYEGTEGKVYQFRAYAKLRKLGEWQPDVGGSVRGYRLTDLENLNSYVDYGNVGERMVKLAQKIKSENK